VTFRSPSCKIEIARILKEEGYISTYKMVTKTRRAKTLRVFLKYTPDRRSVITGMKRISKPGPALLSGRRRHQPVVGGLGISILTTPKGLMTGRSARKAKLGGEILVRSVVVDFVVRCHPEAPAVFAGPKDLNGERWQEFGVAVLRPSPSDGLRMTTRSRSR